MIFEIKHLIHYLKTRGTRVNFCWVPSHCGIYWNEEVDRLAKQGAMNSSDCCEEVHLKKTSNEINSILKEVMINNRFKNKDKIPSCSRQLSSFICKLRLNSWKTKFTNITCVCGDSISVHHVLFTCPITISALADKGAEFPENRQNPTDILYNITDSTMFSINIVFNSSVGKLI